MNFQAMFQPCPVCGRIMNPHSKTCGMCARKGRKKQPARLVTEVCGYCGASFQIPLWRHRQDRGHFCSRKCHDRFLTTIKGPAHPKATGRQAPPRYLGRQWKVSRKTALARAGNHCERCGTDLASVKKYVVHHKVPICEFPKRDDGHKPDNLLVLCQSCHAKHHKLGKMPERKGGDANV